MILKKLMWTAGKNPHVYRLGYLSYWLSIVESHVGVHKLSHTTLEVSIVGRDKCFHATVSRKFK